MSANPPILTVPPQLIEPHNHILRYLSSIKGFTEQHARDGRNHLRRRLAKGSDGMEGQQHEQSDRAQPTAGPHIQDEWQHRRPPQTRRKTRTAARDREDRPLSEAYPNVPLEHAQRLHDRKMRRREKASIRRPTSPATARATSPSSNRWLYDLQPLKKRGRHTTGMIIPASTGRSRRLTIPPDKVRGLFGQGKALISMYIPRTAASLDQFSQSHPTGSDRDQRHTSGTPRDYEDSYDQPGWENTSHSFGVDYGPASRAHLSPGVSRSRDHDWHSTAQISRSSYDAPPITSQQAYAARSNAPYPRHEEDSVMNGRLIEPYQPQEIWPVYEGGDLHDDAYEGEYEDEYEDEYQDDYEGGYERGHGEYAQATNSRAPHQYYVDYSPRYEDRTLNHGSHGGRDIPDYGQSQYDLGATDDLDYYTPKLATRQPEPYESYYWDDIQQPAGEFSLDEQYSQACRDELDPPCTTLDNFAEHLQDHAERYDGYQMEMPEGDDQYWVNDSSGNLQQLCR